MNNESLLELLNSKTDYQVKTLPEGYKVSQNIHIEENWDKLYAELCFQWSHPWAWCYNLFPNLHIRCHHDFISIISSERHEELFFKYMPDLYEYLVMCATQPYTRRLLNNFTSNNSLLQYVHQTISGSSSGSCLMWWGFDDDGWCWVCWYPQYMTGLSCM